MNPAADLDEAALEKMPDGKSHPYFFKGDGKYFFNDVSDLWGTGQMNGYYNGAAYGDLNNDGAPDVVINSLEGPAIILKNNSTDKNFLSISFKGYGLNTMGIGSKAYVFSGNKMQYQQLIPTRGFQSSSDPRLHFGLDSISVIDSIIIVWPDQKWRW